MKGTPGYAAPEMLENRQFSGPSADVFAAVIVLFILVTGRPPFISATKVDFRYSHVISNNWTEFWEKQAPSISPSFKDFIEKSLCYEGDVRLGMDDMLKHPWMNGEKADSDEIAGFM